MDFHSLSRRELQALCKMNKIPANMTNVAMADALKALEFVEGIEEILKPSESEIVEFSIESPEKSEITSPSVPRTGCRTTTRRKTVKDEPGTLQTVARSRRTTTKMLDETPAEAAPTTRRRAAAGSVRRKIEISSKESKEVEKEKKDVPETPAVVTASRRRGVKETSSVKHVYSTRRSTRLAEKNVDEKERFEAIKIYSFAEEMDENLEINLKEGSDDELTEVTENNEFDLKAPSKEDDEVGIKEEEANDMEIDAALSSEVEGHVIVEDEPSDDNKADDNGTETKSEVDSEMSDETKVHSGDNGVQENNENASDKEMKLDTNKDEDSEFVGDENLESEVPKDEGCTNIALDSTPCETDTVIEDETEDVVKKDVLTGEYLDDNAELESDFPNDMISTNQFNQEQPDTEDVSQLVMNMDDVTCPVSNGIFECENPIKDAKQVTQDEIRSGNVLDAENFTMETSGLQLDAENFTMETSGLQSARGVFLPFFETASNPIVHPTGMTPLKNSLSTTPMMKSAGRRVTNISDDKENVDSGRKLVLTKEEKPKKKDFAGIKNQKPLEDLSMRQLTKMFKEKLEITKLNKSNADDIKTATTRPALRTLSENCLVGESQN